MASVRVLLSIPSIIGAPDRQLEAPASSRSATGPVEFSIGVPQSALGRSADIRIVPVMPIDSVLPVWTMSLPMLGPTITLYVPRSNDLNTVEGVLQSALGASEPVLDYAARAVVGDRLVSNVAATKSQGHFTLQIPKSINPDTVTVELAPVDATMARPTMLIKLSGKLNLGALRLPPYSKPQAIDVPVSAMDTTKKLSGVTVRFYTVLPGTVGTDAIATFRQELQTDKNGIAHAQILPASAGETRSYAVAAIPAPDSQYAARCFPSYAVAAASGSQARVGASLELVPKLEITGQVQDGDGNGLQGVILTAIRTDSTYVDACGGDVASAQPTVTTGVDGSYRLRIEPGTYRFDYEPPMGSISPLLVEGSVVVARSMQRNVMLPAGALAEGIVKTPDDGSPVAACEVRVFAPSRGGAPPELRAHTRTAVDGRFRIVLPRTP
jgi:hypothetical protein